MEAPIILGFIVGGVTGGILIGVGIGLVLAKQKFLGKYMLKENW